MKNIVVVGSSFAGLMTIKTLRRQRYHGPIVLLAPKPEMFYYPASIWVPSAIYTEHELTFPLGDFMRRHHVEYVAGSITRLNATEKQLSTTAGEFTYQRLVIATGGQSKKKIHGLEHVIIPCDGVHALSALMKRLASLQEGTLAFGFSGNANEPTAVRGEPLFEFLFGIDTLLRRQKRRDRFRLVFFTSCAEIDARWGVREKGILDRELERRGIERYVNQTILGFDADRVILGSVELKSELTVFIPELVGPAWAIQSDLPLSEDGFIRADASCRVLGFEENVYVAGDAGYFPTPAWIPKHGHTANHHALALARNLIGDLRGERTTHTFRQEFVYIVDTLEGGLLVFRDEKRSGTWRNSLLHWAKRLFIWVYLYEYRKGISSRKRAIRQ